MPRLLLLLTGVSLLCASRILAADTERFTAPLPDPLVAPGGKHITTSSQWTKEQRPRILELFRSEVYGRAPVERPTGLHFQVISETPSLLGGTARRKIIRITYTGPLGEGKFDTTMYLPAEGTARGVFVLIDNRTRAIIDKADTDTREFWPVDDIVKRGYATAAFHYSDLAADDKEHAFTTGVYAVLGPKETRTDDSWGTLGAWAWGASRIVDYLATDPDLKGKPIAVIGHSRGGKAALWCGAQDTRIALTISNDSGQGGAALSRRKQGETVEVITRVFPYWFALNYRKYADHESNLPLDQHWLISLLAPRLAYVASARDDAWADPSAEFASAVAAEPVYKLFGLSGVGAGPLPADNSPRHDGAIGYHVRPGKHDLTRIDWNYYLDFTDRHWNAANKK
jgi:hypothetical protein